MTMQYNDLALEHRGYTDAAALVAADPNMRADFAAMHTGEVVVPPRPPAALAVAAASQGYIDLMVDKQAAVRAVSDAEARQRALRSDAERAADETRELALQLDQTGVSMSVEARVAGRKRMLKL